MDRNLTVTILDQLGAGSYGSVFKYKDENSNFGAVKKCSIKGDHGIVNLLEATIMCSFRHPFINLAKIVLPTDTHIYLLQNKAVCDLSSFLKDEKNKNVFLEGKNTLSKWCWQLAKSVQVLHYHKIIHGDLKTRNILLDENGDTKLTDFGMSLMMISPNIQYTHITGTNNHRPLENFQGKPFNEKLDIWSLGCCFHTIFFGRPIFPIQEGTKLNPNYEKYINCLLDWNLRGNIFKSEIKEKMFHIPYKQFTIDPKLEEKDNMHLKFLIHKCLRANPDKRPNINQIVSDLFFSGKDQKLSYDIRISDNFLLSKPEEEFLEKNLTNFSQEEKEKISQIFSKIPPNLANETLRLELSISIYYKLCYGISGKKRIKNDPKLIDLESKFCSHLGFCLL